MAAHKTIKRNGSIVATYRIVTRKPNRYEPKVSKIYSVQRRLAGQRTWMEVTWRTNLTDAKSALPIM
jgi:hypothetical protein